MHAILTHPVVVAIVVLCTILSLWQLHREQVQPRDLDIRAVGKRRGERR